MQNVTKYVEIYTEIFIGSILDTEAMKKFHV